MPELMRISRQLLPFDHQALRSHMEAINRLGDLGIKWRRLGATGVTFVERGLYGRAAGKQAGKLALMSTGELARQANTNMLPHMPGGNGRLEAAVTNIDYFGSGPYLSIAYTLESEKLEAERQYITAKLDQLNGVNNDWGEFDPHVTLATISPLNASDEILEAFWDFAPEQLTLMPAQAGDS